MWYRIAILTLVLLASPSQAMSPATQVAWPIQKMFVPTGFDDNDKVQVTVTGEFPNTCYRVGPYHSKVDDKARVITIIQSAYAFPTICLDILIPFTQVIDVGFVPAGDYTVVDSSTGNPWAVRQLIAPRTQVRMITCTPSSTMRWFNQLRE